MTFVFLLTAVVVFCVRDRKLERCFALCSFLRSMHGIGVS